MAEDVGRSPDGSGSRPADRASDAVSPVPASIPSVADVEIDAMRDAYLALSRVPPVGQVRALDWLSARLGWEHRVAGELSATLGAALRHIELAVRRQRRRQPASAIEARSGETVQQGSTEGESAVPQADAQTPSKDHP